MKALLIAAAIGAASGAIAQDAPLNHADFDRVFTIVSSEPKMYRDVRRTPYPDTLDRFPELFAMGGYRLEEPNADGEWYARAYLWDPATIVVKRGETVLLEFFGINGDEHRTAIEGVEGEVMVRRGEITQVPFAAREAGIFRFASLDRMPSMVGQIVVID